MLAEYYFGHRLSFDVDLFTGETGLVLPLSYQVEALSEKHGFVVTPVRRFATYVEFLVSTDDSSLKVDLAQDSPFRFDSPRGGDGHPGQRLAGPRSGQAACLLRSCRTSAYAVDLHFICGKYPGNVFWISRRKRIWGLICTGSRWR